VRHRRKLSIKAQEWVDERIQAKVLTMLLESYPGARTLPELTREIGDRDAVNRALCALAEYGLLEFEGGKTETLRPTLAARSCVRLLEVAHSPLSAQRVK
jgi:predicted transcriptional regulator